MKLKNIVDNISFHSLKDCDKKEINKILEIRNEEKIRENMFTQHIISIDEHTKWFDKLKSSDTEEFYCVKYKKKIIGGLGLKDLKKGDQAYWSFHISQNENFAGLGASIEFKALVWFFSNFNLKKIYCYVLKKNPLVVKLHRKFGFVDENSVKTFKQKNIDYNDVEHLELSKNKWQEIKESFEKDYLN